MPPDPRKYLWDALSAADQARSFAEGCTLNEYLANAMLRAAVERQFEIIGEALNQLSKAEPELASGIPDLPRIVAFRNILIHGYAMVDDVLAWQVAFTVRRGLIAEVHILTDAAPGGFTLTGLRDRVASVGGRLTTASTPDTGTTVEAVLPCAS